MNRPDTRNDIVSLLLRIGLGLVFVIGGTSKLSQLLSAEAQAGIVSNYMGTSGYINSLFQQWLFTGAMGNILSPWGFLTALSSFELVSGIFLIVGLFIRPLALLYAFLLWTFVIALPTMTVPGEALSVKTYTSPALLVQARDVGLSGFMFVLFCFGAGRFSLDHRFVPHTVIPAWDDGGLLLRISLGLVLLIGALFQEFAYIASFATPAFILLLVSVVVLFGSPRWCRYAGFATVAVMLWFMTQKINLDKTIVQNLNGFKREFAFAACGIILGVYGGGEKFTAADIVAASKRYCRGFVGKGSGQVVIPD